MKRKNYLILAGCLFLVLIASTSLATEATVETVALFQLPVTRIAADADGYLYTIGRWTVAGATVPNGWINRTGVACPVWRFDPKAPLFTDTRFNNPFAPYNSNFNPVIVGYMPAFSSSLVAVGSGIVVKDGYVYVSDATNGANGVIYRFIPNSTNPPTPATYFATTSNGANALAFDKKGNLWVTDGTGNQGKVWKVGPTGYNGGAPAFYIPTMRNLANVGRTVSRLPGLGATNEAVAAGIAFDRTGNLFISDAVRGAIWKIEFDKHGEVESPLTSDTTYPQDTLDFSNIFFQHAMLEGCSGIALDVAGNFWCAANERQAIVVVTHNGRIEEIFRNPVNSAGFRSSADPIVQNNHILEFPLDVFILGKTLYIANLDLNFRDNSDPTPSSNPIGPMGGEICPQDSVTCPWRGKISVLTQ
jgi:sugar lactone lactonase YvrE